MKSAFTLVELLVVVGMIALLTGAVGNSVSQARKRARLAKAQAEVKEMTNAILAYEQSGHELKTLNNAVATANELGFILGKGEDGEKTAVLYNGNVGSDGVMRDPWGRPYRVSIVEGDLDIIEEGANAPIQTGYFLPNFYRLSAEERAQ